MPIHDVLCTGCNHEFEVIRSVNDKMLSESPPKCPQCGKKKTRQVFKKPPAYHNHYSPMHPRINRGRGY